jgi:opacity protein-like surface antigen
LKSKLILITVLALGSLAHAQGFASHLSIGVGVQGIFPAGTFTRSTAINFGNANTQSTSNSAGAIGGVRYDFGRHSALDVAVTVNRDTEYFFSGSNGSGFISSIQTNNAEIIGSYIFRLPSNAHVKPYTMLGGGAVRFSPNGVETATGVPQTETKAAFAYGFGTDFTMSEHLSLRLQYRGLVRSEPDFKLLNDPNNPFGTGLKTHVVEPSIQIVYHF